MKLLWAVLFIFVWSRAVNEYQSLQELLLERIQLQLPLYQGKVNLELGQLIMANLGQKLKQKACVTCGELIRFAELITHLNVKMITCG